MPVVKIRAVIAFDGANYVIHGSNGETPAEMFKAIAPIWDFDPSKESVHYVELDVSLENFVHEHDPESN